MKQILLAAALMMGSHMVPASAQPAGATDPAADFARLFGLGGRACKQYDDTGRLYIYSEGIPSHGVVSWLQQSDGGTKSSIPMPEELAVALPLIPGCMPGKHHAAAADRARTVAY